MRVRFFFQQFLEDPAIAQHTGHPQIHTEHYEYPDALLEPTVEAFRALLTSE